LFKAPETKKKAKTEVNKKNKNNDEHNQKEIELA